MKKEQRFIFNKNASIEVRSAGEGDQQENIISGYAAVFYNGTSGTEYKLYRDYFERIHPEAFNEAIQNDDVRALFNHDMNKVLGRTASNTLKLSVDNRGLKYEITVPNTSIGKDLVESIKRGDITGSSFSFEATAVEWIDEEEKEIRLIKKVSLYDVGPVTFPAYSATETEARSQEIIQQELEQLKNKNSRSENSENNTDNNNNADADFAYATIKAKGIKI